MVQNSYRNIIFIFSICLFISLVSILRQDFGINPDYESYKNLYTIIDHVKFDDIDGINDKGFLIFVFFVKALDISFDFFLWLVCFFCLIIKVFCIAKLSCKSTVFFIFFYVITFFLLHELVQIRIAIAISLFYLALNFIMLDALKYRLLYLFIAALAMSFHLSVIFVFLIPIVKIKLRLFLIILSVLTLSLNVSFFYSDLIEYLSMSSSVSVDVISYLNELNSSVDNLSIVNSANILTLMFIILSLFLHDKIEVSDSEQYILELNVKFLIISLVMFYIFSNSPVVAYRMSEIFRVLIPIASGIILVSMYEKSKFPLVVMFILVINIGFFVNYFKAVLVL